MTDTTTHAQCPITGNVECADRACELHYMSAPIKLDAYRVGDAVRVAAHVTHLHGLTGTVREIIGHLYWLDLGPGHGSFVPFQVSELELDPASACAVMTQIADLLTGDPWRATYLD